MTDVSTTAEMPVEPAPILPAPDAAADSSTNVEDGTVNNNNDNGADGAPSTNVDAVERTLPDGIEHLGVLRRGVLDALADADEPLNVARILQELPAGTTRNAAESAIKREHDAGRITRTSPGHYTLAPVQPPGQPQPAPQPDPVPSGGVTDEQWLDALDAYSSTGLWYAPGNPPGQAGCSVLPGIIARHNDRIRKRDQRRKEAESAAAKRNAADAELRNRLVAATDGNIVPGAALDDLEPIKAALAFGVPLDRIVYAVRYKTDRKMFPGNEPATSWREERLLRKVAETYFESLIPNGWPRGRPRRRRYPRRRARCRPPPCRRQPRRRPQSASRCRPLCPFRRWKFRTSGRTYSRTNRRPITRLLQPAALPSSPPSAAIGRRLRRRRSLAQSGARPRRPSSK
jgi:hypothetical protein